MKNREFYTSCEVPKSEVGENLNTRELPDLQYVMIIQYMFISVVGRYYLACLILTCVSLLTSILSANIWSKGDLKMPIPEVARVSLYTVIKM